jgi:hypothetical protein
MNEMMCEFCSTVFKTKSALNNHKKSAKYCLLIQDEKKVTKKCKEQKKSAFNCKYCFKNLSTKQNLMNHLESCNEKKYKEYEKELKELKETNNQFIKDIIEKDKILIKVTTQLENCKEQLENYKEQLEKQEEKLDSITNKAMERPTIVSNKTTNNLNIKSSLDFNNLDKIKDALETQFNVDHVVDGQKGLAKFMVKTMLTDDDGNLLYVCTDSSRNIFKYKNSAGEINKDVEAKKLISFMVDAGIKGKSVEIARGWYTEDGEIDITRYEIMSDSQQRILKIEDDSNSFKKELVSMTTVS